MRVDEKRPFTFVEGFLGVYIIQLIQSYFETLSCQLPMKELGAVTHPMIFEGRELGEFLGEVYQRWKIVRQVSQKNGRDGLFL